MKLGGKKGCGISFWRDKKTLRFRVSMKHPLLLGKTSEFKQLEVNLKGVFHSSDVKKRTVEVASSIVAYILNRCQYILNVGPERKL